MSQTKSVLSRILNVATIVLACYVVFNLFQQYRSGEKLSGRSVAELPVTPLDGNESFTLGSRPGPKVVVLWATWCGPCTLELSRLNNLVKGGDVDPKQVFAISVGEDRMTVEQAARERGYAFPVYWDDAGLTDQWIPIQATPTTAYVKADNTVEDVDTGVNPAFGLKVSKFLKR